MTKESDLLVERLNQLGLVCQTAPIDQLTSATAALACFPMYMMAQAEALFAAPGKKPANSASMLEAFSIGRREGLLDIEPLHAQVLAQLLESSRPSDRTIYDAALTALAAFLAGTTAEVRANTCTFIAQSIVGVARASGGGWLSGEPRVNSAERQCLDAIDRALGLTKVPAAAAALRVAEDS
jgi:hypothetical protein